MLRKHIFEVCAVRREFVEQGQYLDEEWESDLVNRTGGQPNKPDKVRFVTHKRYVFWYNSVLQIAK